MISLRRACRLTLFDSLSMFAVFRCGVTLIECPKRSSTSSQFAFCEEEITGGRLKCLSLHIRRPVWDAKWCRRGSEDPATVRQRPPNGQPPTRPYMIFTWTTSPTHVVHNNHAPGYTHMDADAHLDDYSWPPGASLKLFSRDLAKRERGSEMSIRGSENESP